MNKLLEPLMRTLSVFVTAMCPFVENRGSILLAASLHVKWYQAFATSTTGNFLSVSCFLRNKDRWIEWGRQHPNIAKVLQRVETMRQTCPERVRQNAALVLMLAITIPFTGMGAWIGCLLAEALGLDRRTTLLVVLVGIIGSGLITTACAYSLLMAGRALLHQTFSLSL